MQHKRKSNVGLGELASKNERKWKDWTMCEEGARRDEERGQGNLLWHPVSGRGNACDDGFGRFASRRLASVVCLDVWRSPQSAELAIRRPVDFFSSDWPTRISARLAAFGVVAVSLGGGVRPHDAAPLRPSPGKVHYYK